jgi:eukaryotic-like serine/threonine-protein kinase
MYPVYVLGEAFRKAGKGEQAADEYQKILSHPGRMSNYPLAALAHLGLARAYAMPGGRPTGPIRIS